MLAVLVLASPFLGASPAAAQAAAHASSEAPAGAAHAFLDAVRALRWQGVAERLHPETLERFRTLVAMIAEADSTDGVGRFLTGVGPADRAGLPSTTIFSRAIDAMLTEMPGLANALHERDDDVLGAVPEGTESAHAVYRTQARIGGSVSEVKVLELGLVGSEWKVRWSDELEVLDAALRGVAMGPREGEP
ncbi:MAG: hypothetical protein AB7T31_15745 [Gemmatimonadales bacterium]